VRSVEDLTPYYVDGDVDNRNYERIVGRVVEAAHEHGDVALLMAGHPRVGVTLVSLLERRAAEGEILVTVLEGVSSFDAMLNELRRDPLEHGAVLIDANRLLYYDYELDPGLDHFVYHVCSVGTTRTHQTEPAKENRLDLLQRQLQRSFGDDHPVVLMEVAGHGSYTREGTVGRLTELLPFVGFGTTLFVPGRARDRSLRNESFAELLAASGDR
jgi:uncharacterized protein YabN with tetrapyrrole methylase and pyrophosphatase domain